MTRLVQVLTAALGLMLIAPDAFAQAKKEPPACAAITFRPVPPGAGDGDIEAGMYKSRFGRIVVKATVKGGQAQGYYVLVNDKKPAAATALPPSVASCAQAKKLPAPGSPSEVCNGDSFKVLIDRAGDKRHVLLYARDGRAWRVCSAGVA